VSTSLDRNGSPSQRTLGPVPADVRTAGLTYEPFYGLKEKPFSLTSDARFFYQSRSHAPAFDDLLNAIKRRESLTVLTGDIGTGKTTLCRAVLQNLDRKTFSAFVTDPFATREDLLKVLLTDFGVASVDDLTSGRVHHASRTELSYLLYDFLATLAPLQAFAVVFIDEAQNLSLPLLEEIRILSDADGQLQVVLVGQLEFREKLKLAQMRQLDQRVSVHCRLEPLDVAGVSGYISHRVHRAGGSADRLSFSGDAVEAIYELSGGVPRIINKLCDRALHLGHTRKVSTVDAQLVRAANPDAVPPPTEPVVAPVTIDEPPPRVLPTTLPHSAPAAASPPAVVPATAASAPAIPPPPAPPAAPPMAVAATQPSVAFTRDSVDHWLAGIEDRAAAASRARPEPRDPSAWRDRWAPTDAVSQPEDERRRRLRIRIGRGGPVTRRELENSRTASRQFTAVLLTMTALFATALAAPTVLRVSARMFRSIDARFSPPPPPAVPSWPAPRIALPAAPPVPDGPY
jgi:type II secretory pathway predicted ATPase ExeA